MDQTLAESGVPPVTADQIRGVFGLRHDLIGDRLMASLPANRRAEVLKACELRENVVLARRGGRLFPGIEAVLETLGRRYWLFVVSNCQAGYIEGFECAGNTGLPFVHAAWGFGTIDGANLTAKTPQDLLDLF